jgi:predicted Zn-dependent protease
LFAEVDSLAERALTAGHPGLLRFTSGFGQTTTHALAGELDEAQALAQRLLDFTQSVQPGRAIGEVLVADVLIAKGELESAVKLLRRAAGALAPTGYSWGPLAWMLLAQALGQLGETVEAGKILSRAESRHGLKSMLFAPELALARAWTLSARGDQHGAVVAARDGAKAAERGGQSAVALRALHLWPIGTRSCSRGGCARCRCAERCFGAIGRDWNDAVGRRCGRAGARVTTAQTAAEDLGSQHLGLLADG